MRTWLTLLFFSVLLAFGVAALFVSSASSVDEKNRLVILSPHWEGIQHEFERAFKEHMRRQTPPREVDICGCRMRMVVP